MKRLTVFVLVLLIGCGAEEPPEPATEDPRDQMIVEFTQVMAEIQSRVASVARAQGIMMNNLWDEIPESEGQRMAIARDLDAIKDLLSNQKAKIVRLTGELRDAEWNSRQEKATIANLETIVAALTSQLDERLALITSLTEQLGSMESALEQALTEAAQQTEVAEENRERVEELSRVYFIVESPANLRKLGITCRGAILDKTSLCDIHRDVMTESHVGLSEIVLGPAGTEAKIFTQQGARADLYRVQDSQGMSVLFILNPETFWGLQKDLVVEVKR